jgi:hypothetical protein
VIDLACPWCHRSHRFNAGGFVFACTQCHRQFSVPVAAIGVAPVADDNDPFQPPSELEFQEPILPESRARRSLTSHRPIESDSPALAAASVILSLIGFAFILCTLSSPMLFAGGYATIAALFGVASFFAGFFAPKRTGSGIMLAFVGMLLGFVIASCGGFSIFAVNSDLTNRSR